MRAAEKNGNISVQLNSRIEGGTNVNEWTLEAKVENLPALTAYIEEELDRTDCSMKARMQLDVAVDELFSNISRYAYAPDTGDVTVRFDYDESERTVSITFKDRGIPYDPTKKADPDVTLPAEDRTVGGLGIYLVKKTMDGITYRREDGCNILCIRKKI